MAAALRRQLVASALLTLCLQDNSDAQYSNFRNNIASLILVLGLHLLLRRLYYRVFPIPPAEAAQQSISLTEQDGSPSRSYTPATGVEPRFEQRITFDVLFSILFLFALHGFSAFKIALVLWANYSLAKRLPRHYVPLATWCFNISVLFANELNQGYKYTRMVELLSLGTAGSRGPVTGLAEWMDGHGGLVSRWEISFNVTVLRLISFNLDYYWSLAANGHDLYEVCGPLRVASAQLVSAHGVDGAIRRSNSSPSTCPSETGSLYRPGPNITAFVTMPHMLFIRRCIWPDL